MHADLVELRVVDQHVVNLRPVELDRGFAVPPAALAPERQPVANDDQHLAGLGRTILTVQSLYI